MSVCEIHGTPRRTEPLLRPDGTQMGSLTIDVCDACDGEAEENTTAMLAMLADPDRWWGKS